MTKFTSLYSGSDKNASVIEYKNTKILIDCGGSFRQLCESLKEIDISVNELDGVLITHSHSDHIKALPMLLKHTDLKIYSSLGTHEEIYDYKIDMAAERRVIIAGDTRFYINDILVNPFDTPHDTGGSLGFNFDFNGKIMTYATDVGHIPVEFKDSVKANEFIFLESNHDVEMLKNSARPYFLKQRILGKRGHLSNKLSSEFSNYLIKNNGVKKIMLAHLSAEANTPRTAYETTRSKLEQSGIIVGKDVELQVANRGVIRDTVIF